MYVVVFSHCAGLVCFGLQLSSSAKRWAKTFWVTARSEGLHCSGPSRTVREILPGNRNCQGALTTIDASGPAVAPPPNLHAALTVLKMLRVVTCLLARYACMVILFFLLSDLSIWFSRVSRCFPVGTWAISSGIGLLPLHTPGGVSLAQAPSHSRALRIPGNASLSRGTALRKLPCLL